MPLIDENRTISQLGLNQILKSEHIALRKMAREKNLKTIDGDFVGFYAGPMINASGRMESPYSGLKMLLAKNTPDANKHIQHLDALNAERKNITKEFCIDYHRAQTWCL